MDMDNLEALVLEFLAYRRERNKSSTRQALPAQKVLGLGEGDAKPQRLSYLHGKPGASIGAGWPLYREKSVASKPPTITPAQNDIIPALTPLVKEMLQRFGTPSSQQELDYIVNQVFAAAMKLPPVNESMTTLEMGTWGKAQLLQAVVELLVMHEGYRSGYPS